MKYKIYFLSLVTIVLLAACNAPKVIRNLNGTTKHGVVYTITTEGNGPAVDSGSIVTVHYTGKLTNDTIFDASTRHGRPFSFPVGQGKVIKGWDEGFQVLRQGDRATFTIPAEMAYGNREIGPIPANSTLVFDVEVIKVEKPKELDPWILKSVDTLKTDSGLKYIILQKGSGAKVAVSRIVSVHYTGYLSDGKVFDSSVKRGQPITFEAGVGKVIKGWDEALLKMRVGDRARLIIPPSLAYGDKQAGPIPPNSQLIFDIEIMDVKDK